MRLFFVLFCLNAFAQDTLLIFCSRTHSSLELKSGIGHFTTKNDKIITSGADCIEIFTTKQREELITKIMKLKFSDLSIKTTNSIEAKVCSIQVEKRKQKKTSNQNISIGQFSQFRQSDDKNTSSEISFLNINENSAGNINVNGTDIQLKCRVINKDTYEVKLSLSSINTDGTNSQNISTTINLNKNSSIEIGGIVKNLNGNSDSKGIPSGINYNMQNGQEETKIYLSIK